MVMKALVKAAAVFASAAMAASIPARQTSYPEAFRLSVNVTFSTTDFEPSLQGQEVFYTPNADCTANLTLAPAGQGSIFRVSVDTVGVSHFSDESSPSAGLIVNPGGTATVPSVNVVKLQCSAGTTGISVSSSGLEYQNGDFMACKGDAYHAGVPIALSFKQKGQRPIVGCSVVQLLAVY